MKRFLNVPLWFLFIGSVLGVLLRYSAFAPLPFFKYQNLLHGHSHVMFLGWIFNVLYIGFVINHTDLKQQRWFSVLFIILQLLTVGMLFSFPIQGYGVVSIVLSTLHTILSFCFIYKFFRISRNKKSPSFWFSKTALLFFVLSSLGPFALGYIKASGIDQGHWYNYAIFFYLHFQYNGFFLFGVTSLFVHRLEGKQPKVAEEFVRAGKWFAALAIPTFLLSILYSSPGLIFNIIGGSAAFLQILFALPLLKVLFLGSDDFSAVLPGNMVPFFRFGILCFISKLLLQAASSIPAVAEMAYELRPVLIAYLHLVLVGLLTILLLVWYQRYNTNLRRRAVVITVFTITFVTMEAVLIIMPWWSTIFHESVPSPVYFLFGVALVLSMCCITFCLHARSVVKEPIP